MFKFFISEKQNIIAVENIFHLALAFVAETSNWFISAK